MTAFNHYAMNSESLLNDKNNAGQWIANEHRWIASAISFLKDDVVVWAMIELDRVNKVNDQQ